MSEAKTSDWISCDMSLPPEGVIVETKIDDAHGTRNVAKLRRSGRLWFSVDGSMYVYYSPTHWRTVKLDVPAQAGKVEPT